MKEVEVSLKDLWSIFTRRFKWIVLVALIAVAISAAYTLFCITPLYTSSITLLASSYGDRTNASVTYAEISASQSLIKSYTTLIKSSRVLTKVSDKLDGEYTVGQLRGMLSAQGIEDTQIITVNIETPDPEASARIGNALADVMPAEVASWEIGGKMEVIDRAVIPGGPSSPNLTTNMIIAAMIGAVLCYAAFFIFERLDTVLHDEEQLRATFDIPILGTVAPLDIHTQGYGGYGDDKKAYGFQKGSAEAKKGGVK